MPQRSGVWVPRKGKTGKKGKTGGGKEHDDDAVGETKTKKNRKNRKNKKNKKNKQRKAGTGTVDSHAEEHATASAHTKGRKWLGMKIVGGNMGQRLPIPLQEVATSRRCLLYYWMGKAAFDLDAIEAKHIRKQGAQGRSGQGARRRGGGGSGGLGGLVGPAHPRRTIGSAFAALRLAAATSHPNCAVAAVSLIASGVEAEKKRLDEHGCSTSEQMAGGAAVRRRTGRSGRDGGAEETGSDAKGEAKAKAKAEAKAARCREVGAAARVLIELNQFSMDRYSYLGGLRQYLEALPEEEKADPRKMEEATERFRKQFRQRQGIEDGEGAGEGTASNIYTVLIFSVAKYLH